MPVATPAVLPIVSVLEPGSVGTGFGANVALDGDGLPVAASVTGLLKSETEPTSMLYVAGVPAQTETSSGVDCSVKPGVPHSANLKLPMRVRQLNWAVVA